MTDIGTLIAVKYVVGAPWAPPPNASTRITIEARSTPETGVVDAWAACQSGNCARADGHWEFEPYPSSRTDEFIDATRFKTPGEALAAAYLCVMTDHQELSKEQNPR